jgi:hypothetical protein
MNDAKSIHEKHEKTVSRVARELGNDWKVDHVAVKRSANGSHKYALSNDSGLYIFMSPNYKALPQWRLCYKKYRRFDDENYYYAEVEKIGCSFDKSPKLIASDLKNRLLCHSTSVFERIKNEAIEEKKCATTRDALKMQTHCILRAINQQQHIINACERDTMRLETVITLAYDHEFEFKGKRTPTRIAKGEIFSTKPDSFKLELYSLTAEQVIKMLAVLEE